MRHSPLMAITCCSGGEDDVILRPSVGQRAGSGSSSSPAAPMMPLVAAEQSSNADMPH